MQLIFQGFEVLLARKGGPGSGGAREGAGRKPGSGKPKPASSRLSARTQEIVQRHSGGQGRAVKYNRQQLEEILNHGTFALVSAGRNLKDPKDAALTDSQVAARYSKLEADLKASGYSYTTVEGHYGGKEDSFLVQVHEADRAEMVKLGEKYNQDSVIYTKAQKNEMIYTTGDDKGKAVRGEGWSWQDSADDFYTEVRHSDGTQSKFQLNFNFDAGAKTFTISFGYSI